MSISGLGKYASKKGEDMSTRMRRSTCAGLLLLIVASVCAAAPDKDSQPSEKAVFEEHFSAVITDLAFSPDGKFLAVVNVSGEEVHLWDVAAGKVARVLPHRQVLRAQFSPDGKVVATGGKYIKLWDVASGKELAMFKFVSWRWLLFSADSKNLAAIAKDEVTILSVEKRKLLRSYDVAPSRRVVFAYPSLKNPVYAAIRGKGRPIALVDPFTEKEVLTCETPITPSFLAFDREEKILAMLSKERREGIRLHDAEVYVWDRGKQKAISNFKLPPESGQAMALSPDGKVMAAYGEVYRPPPIPYDSYILFYDVLSGRLLARMEQRTFIVTDPSYEASRFLAFSPDGRLLATSFNTSAVKLWSLPDSWRKKK